MTSNRSKEAVPRARWFNPDDALEGEGGRLYTPERSAAAFERAYVALEAALRSAPPDARLFVVIGVQGAGKTTWISNHAAALGARSFFFDAALPRTRHRARVLAIAKAAGVPATAVWIRATVETALQRNLSRRQDHQVPESAIRSVYAMLEPPSPDEGFQAVWEIQA